MNRDEFMRELEYLLSDIPDEEKADAIEYYRDYLEEAGPENEEKVIQEFGSPERVAAIIRSDISGSLKDGGEFTDHGYEDERFKDPNYQMAKRYDLPEPSQFEKSFEKEEESRAERAKNQGGVNKAVKICLWLILIIVASPILIGIGSGIVGIAAGLFACVLGLLAALGAITLAFLLSGIALVFGGIVVMIMHPMSGILVLGLGILLFGFGILGIAACWVFYGSFFPFLFRSVINAVSGLIHGRRARS